MLWKSSEKRRWQKVLMPVMRFIFEVWDKMKQIEFFSVPVRVILYRSTVLAMNFGEDWQQGRLVRLKQLIKEYDICTYQ